MINWLLRKTDPGVKQAHDVATVSRFVDNELTVVLGLFAVRHDRLLVLLSFHFKLEMWANAQPDGRPAEYR